MPDLTMRIAEDREKLNALQWEESDYFPRLVGYVNEPCKRTLTRALRLVRVHADRIRAGQAPRLESICRELPHLARESAQRGQDVCEEHPDAKRRGISFDGKMQARWLGWVITDAIGFGHRSRGEENDLGIDILNVIRELVVDMPWHLLTKPKRESRVSLLRWFADEISQVIAPQGDGLRSGPGGDLVTTGSAGPSGATGGLDVGAMEQRSE
jgi:hypothetical protein